MKLAVLLIITGILTLYAATATPARSANKPSNSIKSQKEAIAVVTGVIDSKRPAAKVSDLQRAESFVRESSSEEDRAGFLVLLAAAYQTAGNATRSASLFNEYNQWIKDKKRDSSDSLLELAAYTPVFTGSTTYSIPIAKRALKQLTEEGKEKTLSAAAAYTVIGMIHLERKEVAEGEQNLKQAEALYKLLDPSSYILRDIKDKYIEISIQKGEHSKAEELCKEIIETEKKKGYKSNSLVTYISRLASVYECSGQPARALETYTSWAEHLRNKPFIYRFLLQEYAGYLKEHGDKMQAERISAEAQAEYDCDMAGARSVNAVMTYANYFFRNKKQADADKMNDLELRVRELTGEEVERKIKENDPPRNTINTPTNPVSETEMEKQKANVKAALINYQVVLDKYGKTDKRQKIAAIIDEFQKN